MTDRYKIKMTFVEPILGMTNNNPELYEEFLASQIPDENLDERAAKLREELDSLPLDDKIQKGTTVWMRTEEGKPFVFNYVIKGMLKDYLGMLRRVPNSRAKKITAYKKVIDGLVFPSPRKIIIHPVGDAYTMTRPLRAQTAQGERVALASSETFGPGSWIEFELKVLAGLTEADLTELFDYGQERGFGQWRNAGYGQYEYTLEKIQSD